MVSVESACPLRFRKAVNPVAFVFLYDAPNNRASASRSCFSSGREVDLGPTTEGGVSGYPARLWCNINSALTEVRSRQVRDGNRYWVVAFGKFPLFHTGRIRWIAMRRIWGVHPSRKLCKIVSVPITTLRERWRHWLILLCRVTVFTKRAMGRSNKTEP